MTDREWVHLADDWRSLDVVPAADFARVWAAAGVAPGEVTGESLAPAVVRRLGEAAREVGAAEIGGALKRSRGSVSARYPDGQPFTGGES